MGDPIEERITLILKKHEDKQRRAVDVENAKRRTLTELKQRTESIHAQYIKLHDSVLTHALGRISGKLGPHGFRFVIQQHIVEDGPVIRQGTITLSGHNLKPASLKYSVSQDRIIAFDLKDETGGNERKFEIDKINAESFSNLLLDFFENAVGS